MRAPTPALTAGLSAAAAAVLLTACGGSGTTSDASAGGTSGGSSGATSTGSPGGGSGATSGGSSGSTSTGSAGSGSAAEDIAAWCDRAVALSSDLQATLAAAGSHPTRVAPVLQAAADQYAHVDGPAPIASDWVTVVAAVQTLATAAQGIDFSSPDAGSRLAASISDQGQALNTATSNVETYANANCPSVSPTPSG